MIPAIPGLVDRYIAQVMHRKTDAASVSERCADVSFSLQRFLQKRGHDAAVYVLRKSWDAPNRNQRPAVSSERIAKERHFLVPTTIAVPTAPLTLRRDGIYVRAFGQPADDRLSGHLFRHFLVRCGGWWIDLTIRQFATQDPPVPEAATVPFVWRVHPPRAEIVKQPPRTEWKKHLFGKPRRDPHCGDMLRWDCQRCGLFYDRPVLHGTLVVEGMEGRLGSPKRASATCFRFFEADRHDAQCTWELPPCRPLPKEQRVR